MSKTYELQPYDQVLVGAADVLLTKLFACEALTAAKLVSVAKLQHALRRAPRVTQAVNVAVTVQSPRRWFDDIQTYHWWTVALNDGELSISSGGHFYRKSTGGDSFTSMTWSASPGSETDYSDNFGNLGIIPDLRSFEDAAENLNFASGAYSIEVIDEDNALLGDELEDEEPDSEEAAEDEEAEQGEDVESEFDLVIDDDPAIEQVARVGESAPDAQPDNSGGEAWKLSPTNPAETRLASTVRASDVDAREAEYAFGVEACDLCATSLEKLGLFIDGALRGQMMWANMCAECFDNQGAGVAWGKGQLYARQPDGEWRLVAGFRLLP